MNIGVPYEMILTFSPWILHTHSLCRSLQLQQPWMTAQLYSTWLGIWRRLNGKSFYSCHSSLLQGQNLLLQCGSAADTYIVDAQGVEILVHCFLPGWRMCLGSQSPLQAFLYLCLLLLLTMLCSPKTIKCFDKVWSTVSRGFPPDPVHRMDVTQGVLHSSACEWQLHVSLYGQ